MEDMFGSSLNLEEAHIKEGYEEGYDHGVAIGKEEGKQVGLTVGYKIGEELGFYQGCVDVWRSVIETDPALFSARVKNSVQLMEKLLKTYPILEPENKTADEMRESLRLKFQVVRANLGVGPAHGCPEKPMELQF